MKKKVFRYIYGPVSSWRLGRSLGIDLLSQKKKICSFDCSYCQVGPTRVYTKNRRTAVKIKDLIEELKTLPPLKIDYVTFSGRGEPTLAKNLGEAILMVRRILKKPVAVLTNASLMNLKSVREELALADLIVAKIDVASEEEFRKISRPVRGIKLKNIISGIKQFAARNRKKLALQIMFVKENKNSAEDLADLARKIRPHEIHINTPLRPCKVKPLTKKEISSIKKHFKGLRNVTSVYEVKLKKTLPISKKATLTRRGKIK